MDYEKIEKSARLSDRVRKTVTYFFLTVWGILVLFPFYWMVLTSVKSYSAPAIPVDSQAVHPVPHPAKLR